MYNILVVDDNKTNLQLVKQVLSKKYSVIPVLSGKLALQYLSKKKPDLILLDLLMPDMDGREFMKAMKKMPNGANVPVIILTSDTGKETEVECLQLGAADFIGKPFVPEVMISRIDKTIELDMLRNRLEQKLEENSRQMERVTLSSMATLSNLIDAREECTRDHSNSVSKYSIEVADHLGWSEEQKQNLHYVALLHDIGKVVVPDYILNKPEPLTEDEYELIKSHTKVGAELLKDIKLIQDAGIGAQYHHERYDGTGYPEGLKGEEIPIIARILGVADAYVAMGSDRIYRTRLTNDKIVEELLKGRGTQFDPELVDIMLEIHKNEEQIVQEYTQMSLDMTSLLDESNLLLQRVLEEQNTTESSLATIDPLTGIHNRRYLETEVTRFLRDKSNKGSFFMIDLDNFKNINDTYGHLEGDRALKLLANMLRKNARNSDILCRMGGDEFAIFFPGLVSKRILRIKANWIMKCFSEMMLEEEILRLTTMSIGIAVSGVDGTDYKTLYENADKSLYYVKQNGKNAIHFYSGESEQSETVEDVQFTANLRSLMSILKEREKQKGVLKVGYNDFQRIYNFINRCVERNKHQVQILLFNIINPDGDDAAPEVFEQSVQLLEKCISDNLRRADVSTRYTNSQFVVIIVDSDEEGANQVLRRIEENYISNNVDKLCVLSYEKAQIQ